MKNLTGQRFYKLTVIKLAGSNRQGSKTWHCLCDCGIEKTFSSDHLTRKKYPVKSCGCLKKTINGKNHHQLNGFGEISGNWWYNHVARERKQTVRISIPIEINIKE